MSNAFLKKHGNQEYPWKQWLDGRWHTVTQGQHFRCKVASFRRRLDQQETDTGLTLDIEPIRKGDKSVKFRFREQEAKKAS